MPAAYTQSDQFRGARIHLCDLAGLEIRDCEVSGLKIVDCYGGDVYLGGAFERLVVNDVDVTAYVEAELDRQHPTRVLAREAASSADYRAAWDAIETQWEATLDRARLLPEAKLHEQVNGEWSFVETQRHLLMAGDAWLGNAVLEEDEIVRRQAGRHFPGRVPHVRDEVDRGDVDPGFDLHRRLLLCGYGESTQEDGNDRAHSIIIRPMRRQVTDRQRLVHKRFISRARAIASVLPPTASFA